MRDWHSGCVLAFQASQTSSTLVSRFSMRGFPMKKTQIMLIPESLAEHTQKKLDNMSDEEYDEFRKNNKVFVLPTDLYNLATKLELTGELDEVLQCGGSFGLIHRLKLKTNTPKIVRLFAANINRIFPSSIVALLKNKNISTVKELLVLTEKDLLRADFTPEIIVLLKSVLLHHGLFLRDDKIVERKKFNRKTKYELEEEINELNIEKEEAVLNLDFAKAARLRYEIVCLRYESYRSRF